MSTVIEICSLCPIRYFFFFFIKFSPPSIFLICSFSLNLSDSVFLSPHSQFPPSPHLSCLSPDSCFGPGFIRSTNLSPITRGLLIRLPPSLCSHWGSQPTDREGKKSFPRQSSGAAWRLIGQTSCFCKRWRLPWGQLLDP